MQKTYLNSLPSLLPHFEYRLPKKNFQNTSLGAKQKPKTNAVYTKKNGRYKKKKKLKRETFLCTALLEF